MVPNNTFWFALPGLIKVCVERRAGGGGRVGSSMQGYIWGLGSKHRLMVCLASRSRTGLNSPLANSGAAVAVTSSFKLRCQM